jgi:hypothetical protein
MSKLIQDGRILRIGEVEATYDKLPKGVYNLRQDSNGEFFLVKEEEFTLPKKIYGDTSIVDRWYNTYMERPRNLGVLLSGLKGAGKTITAKMLAMKTDLPVITVTASFKGPAFISFLTDPVLGDCVIFMDEYEKVYASGNDETDDSLLSILDGPYQTHHLFIFTVNRTYINSSLMNRPSRIFYKKEFRGLTNDQVREIAKDLLKDQSKMDDLLKTTTRLFDVSYDIILSLIEEMNRYDEPASQSIEYMNLTPSHTYFNITQIYKEGNEVMEKNANNSTTLEYDSKNGYHFAAKIYFKRVFENNEIIKSSKTLRKQDNWDYTYVTIPFDENILKINEDTYEYFDGVVLYRLSQTNENRYSSAYSYGARPESKLINNPPEPIVLHVDEKGHYLRHTPADISLDWVKETFPFVFEDHCSSDDDLFGPGVEACSAG